MDVIFDTAYETKQNTYKYTLHMICFAVIQHCIIWQNTDKHTIKMSINTVETIIFNEDEFKINMDFEMFINNSELAQTSNDSL